MEMPVSYDEDTEASQRIARHLSAYAKRHDLNQSQLAQELGVDHSTLNRVLSGKRGVGLGLALRIARRLLIDPHELLLKEPHL